MLAAVPTAVFVLPDLLGGHLLMAGDNVQQNYPLHVLVGSALRHGQIPLWDPYIFSGTPLLAGFNAGAFYPLVGLFVILPDRVAWIATEAILFTSIGIGMFAFLRAMKLSTRACFLGALTFTFAGTVFSQVNHLDMTEGFAALPWMLLAVLHIVRDGRWRWSVLLGVAFATVVLGGAPEAMLDEAILVLAYAVLLAGFDRVRWWRVVTRAGAGAALGLALSAVQWLPGLSAIANSQRSGVGGAFAAAGGFLPPFGLLSVVPYLFGGYGHLGEAQFFSRYNLPEVGIYLGILPVIALVTLLHPRWPTRLAGRDRLVWYLLGLLGLLLALGPATPLEHIFNSIPLYGHQRLQSRNMIDVSVAVCVLFAGWIDRTGEPSPSMKRFERAMAFIPVGAVGALALWAFIGPTSLLQNFGYISVTRPSEIHTAREASLIALAFCVTALVIVWLRSRLGPKWWFGVAAVFVVVDVGLIAATSQLASFTSNVVLAGQTTTEQYVAAHLVPNGRYVVYDPQNIGLNNEVAGFWDLNLLAQLPSVGGYGSIVNANYQNLTNTHSPGDLNIQQLGSGSLDGLDLQDVLTLPEYFLIPLQSTPTKVAEIQHLSEPSGVDPVLPFGNGPDFNDTAYPFYPGSRPSLSAGQSASWFLGEPVQPSSATLLFEHPSSVAVVRFGSLSSTGAADWGPAVKVDAGATSVTGDLPAVTSAGVVVQVIFGQVPAYLNVVTIGGKQFEVDGALSSVVQPSTWRQEGTIHGYTLYVRKKGPTPIYAVAAGTTSGPRVTVVTNQTKIETVRVSAVTKTTIVRDVAWDPGWRGTVSVNGGHPQAVSVRQHGLVQQIVVPAGVDEVTFKYMAPHFLVASVLSLGGVGLLLVLLVVTTVRLRKRRPQRVSKEDEPA